MISNIGIDKHTTFCYSVLCLPALSPEVFTLPAPTLSGSLEVPIVSREPHPPSHFHFCLLHIQVFFFQGIPHSFHRDGGVATLSACPTSPFVIRCLPPYSSPFFSHSCAPFCTFLHSCKTQLFYFQSIPHSLRKMRGGASRMLLLDTRGWDTPVFLTSLLPYFLTSLPPYFLLSRALRAGGRVTMLNSRPAFSVNGVCPHRVGASLGAQVSIGFPIPNVCSFILLPAPALLLTLPFFLLLH